MSPEFPLKNQRKVGLPESNNGTIKRHKEK
jgi:hypothetical protein